MLFFSNFKHRKDAIQIIPVSLLSGIRNIHGYADFRVFYFNLNFFVCIKLPNSCIYAIKLRGGMSGMSCISSKEIAFYKEIAFLTIINLKRAPDPTRRTAPPTPQLLLPRFAPFARASSLRSEGLPRFLLISVLMPVLLHLNTFNCSRTYISLTMTVPSNFTISEFYSIFVC